MNWVKSEYILKGVYLGLLLFAALQNLTWQQTGEIALYVGGGLGIAVVVGMFRVATQLRGIKKSPVSFLIYVILENPMLVYAGIVLGLAVGVLQNRLPVASESNPTGQDPLILGYCILGGALLGYGFGELRAAKVEPIYKFLLALVLGAVMVVGIWFWFKEGDILRDELSKQSLGYVLLLGLPFFYLLTFAGVAEESEVEIAAWCAVLGLGLYYLNPFQAAPNLAAIMFVLPVVVYCGYTIKVLRPLRVFKHTLRGFSHAEVGRIRESLESFNRALQLDRRNKLAKEGLMKLHRTVDLNKLDAETIAMMNPNLCIVQAANILVSDQSPTPEQIKEARKLLGMVEHGWPHNLANVEYYRVIADTHAKEVDTAVKRLRYLLNPENWPSPDRSRDNTLFDAWQLGMRTHPRLKSEAAIPELALPGRRVEAIRAQQRQMALVPNDPLVVEYRDEFLNDITEEEYADALKGPVSDFPYAKCEEIGLALLNSPDHYERGETFLRIAAHGQPTRAPSIFQVIVDFYAKRENTHKVREYRKVIRDNSRDFGIDKLPKDQRAIYFATVKVLAQEAAAIEDYKEAIYNQSLYTQFEDSGKQTLSKLAEYYEKDNQVMEALRVTEKAFVYGSDKDLMAKKDKYYYSIDPDTLRVRATEVKSFFDVKYCTNKAKELLDTQNPDLDVLDWAFHLAQLALVIEPKNMIAMLQYARCQLRRGERDNALSVLEDIQEMEHKGNEERDAWFFTVKQLALLYIDEYNRPDLAIDCLNKYKESEKSGADTYYHLGRAYEAKGDTPNAIRFFEAVIKGYENHPIRYDAEENLRRLRNAV